jgi:hypothetical protein
MKQSKFWIGRRARKQFRRRKFESGKNSGNLIIGAADFIGHALKVGQ